MQLTFGGLFFFAQKLVNGDAEVIRYLFQNINCRYRVRLGFLVGSESSREIVLSTVPALSAKSLWVIPCSCRFMATSNKKLSQFLSSSEFTNSSPVFCYRTLLPEKHDSFCAETAKFVSTYWQCNLLQLNCTKYMLNLEGFLFDNNRQKRRNTNGLEHGVRAAYFTNDT